MKRLLLIAFVLVGITSQAQRLQDFPTYIPTQPYAGLYGITFFETSPGSGTWLPARKFLYSNLLAPYHLNSDTSKFATQYQLSLKASIADVTNRLLKSDTAAMLAPYMRTATAQATYQPIGSYAASSHTHSGLAPTGGTTGQVLKKNSNANYDYAWGNDNAGSGSGSGLPIGTVRLQDYGGVGDSTTDNASAFAAAITALPAGGGVVMTGTGIFKVNSTITVNKPVIFIGSGSATYTYGSVPMLAATKIFTTSVNIDLFNINSDNVQFKGVHIQNLATTPTAGAGIKISSGNGFSFNHSTIDGFYNCIEFVNAYHWSLTNTFIVSGFVNAGVYIRNTATADYGDQMISDGLIYPRTRNGYAGIIHESGGGLKVVNTKFNWEQGNGGAQYRSQFHYRATFQTAPTVDVQFANCSFENYTNTGFYLNPNGNFGGHVTIVGCQFASYLNNTTDINFIGGGTQGYSVVGNTFRGEGSGSQLIANNVTTGYTFAGNSTTGTYAAFPFHYKYIGPNPNMHLQMQTANDYAGFNLYNSAATLVGSVTVGGESTGGLANEMFMGNRVAGKNTVIVRGPSADETARFTSGGRMGLGETSPGAKLTVREDVNSYVEVIGAYSNTTAGIPYVQVGKTSAANEAINFAFENAAATGHLFVSGQDPTTGMALSISTKGVRLPRVTKAQRDALTSVSQGTMLFVTDNGGYISYYNSGWQKVSSVAD